MRAYVYKPRHRKTACRALLALAICCMATSIGQAQIRNTPPERQAPPHNKPIIQKDGKTLLWARENPETGKTEYFDMTGALVDPKQFQYGIGKDTIPSVDKPVFAPLGDPRLAEARITDETIVIGYSAEGVSKAYPVIYMDRHEIVNDMFGETPLAVAW